MKLLVNPHGGICCIYDETIDLTSLGAITIKRASHVEPDEKGFWWADLAPLKGPMIGPFSLRSDALQAERTWIEEHWLVHPLS
jgi:hypothetical protein